MQNAWRFVDDEVLRERLKEAKGIGTPATRAEIIGGLKKQGFLVAEGKHIVPTEPGLSLFGVLKQADPCTLAVQQMQRWCLAGYSPATNDRAGWVTRYPAMRAS